MIVFIAYSNLAAVGIRGHDTRGRRSQRGAHEMVETLRQDNVSRKRCSKLSSENDR